MSAGDASEALKRFIQRRARSAGFVLAKAVAIHSELEAMHVGEFLAHYRVETVFDIGANAGDYAMMLRRRVGFTGRIVSCEPNPDLALRLRKTAANDPKWIIEPCAVGRSAERVRLNITRDDHFSSLLAPTDAETRLFTEAMAIEREVEVEMTTLEALIAKYGKGPVYAKIDTQGSEQAIIEGAGKALSQISALQLELSFKRIYDGAWLFEQALARLNSLGFELSALFPNTPPPFPHLIEMDGIFRNTSLA